MLYAAKGFRDFSNEVFGNCGYPNTLLANSVQNQNSLAVLFPKINKFSNLENVFSSQFTDLENVLSESNFPATKMAVGPF